MAQDPTDYVSVNSAIARAGSVHAASAHALKQGRSPSVGPPSFSLLSLVDGEGGLPDDTCEDTAHESQGLHVAAVHTRNQRALHFAPTVQECLFDANAPPQDVADAATDKQRALRLKPKNQAKPGRTVHPRAHGAASSNPLATTGDTAAAIAGEAPGVTGAKPPASPAEATQAAKAAAPVTKLSNNNKQRGTLRADAGDVCGESDSAQIKERRQTAQSILRKQHSTGKVSERVVQALMRSPLTLQLVDLVELVTHQEQTDLLLRLAQVLESKPDSAVISGSAALEAMHQLLLDTAPTVPVCAAFAELAHRELHPAEAPVTVYYKRHTRMVWQALAVCNKQQTLLNATVITV